MAPRRPARMVVVLGAVAVVLMSTGCQVSTTVSVQAGSGQTGRVVVSVALDRAATAAVGGRPALVSQLADSDLESRGWSVTGPASGPGSSTVVTASHGYSSLVEATQLLAQVAGSGPEERRPLELQVTHHHSFWHVYTDLTGKVDLSCGLGCFGDAGLQGLTGSPLGFDPAPLEQRAGESPAQLFKFALEARLPGGVRQTNAVSRTGDVLRWDPALGKATAVTAVAQDWNWGSIALVIAAAAVVVLALLTVLVLRWRSRRRARPAARRGLHAKPMRGWRRRFGRGKAVSPPS